ncbi:hypothetical protein EVAR_35992_1 [Eumeta japonica]|uniref:Globin domain-containing protein n=1 Tax=Eumeta variegata TaxID=151549 RepID=A0A4C1WWJ2_EUMVA|nr:hypothetical protein EVAR_35992_1 [Eumeta japonica]
MTSSPMVLSSVPFSIQKPENPIFLHRKRTLFEENEELIGLFERFRSLKSREARVRSLPLAEHAATVMRTLDSTIRALPNADEFIARARRAGATHRRVPGFQPHFFWLEDGDRLAAILRILKNFNRRPPQRRPPTDSGACATFFYLCDEKAERRNIEQPFLEAARTTLGDRYTENVQNIYTITIRFVLQNMVSGYGAAPPALTPPPARADNNNAAAT